MKLRTWTAKDIKQGTRVFLRLDANVRKDEEDLGKYGRIAQAVPEIQKLRAAGACILMATHVGEPGGHGDAALSAKHIVKAFERELKTDIRFIKSVLDDNAHEDFAKVKPGECAMLENLRFHPGEEMNDNAFARTLASFADVYVNNAFGVCHRKHASVHAITKHLSSFAGELVVREVEELAKTPKHPFVLVLGGAKVTTKVPLITNLGAQADAIMLGGALSLTFLAAAEVKLPAYPADFMEEGDVALARKVMLKFSDKILLPQDVVADPSKHLVVDIGPKTTDSFVRALAEAKTIIWNGPLGITEMPEGAKGTRVLAKALAKSKARVVVGGGETVAFLAQEGLLAKCDHVSTGGGAMLAFLGGQKLPGLTPLLV